MSVGGSRSQNRTRDVQDPIFEGLRSPFAELFGGPQAVDRRGNVIEGEFTGGGLLDEIGADLTSTFEGPLTADLTDEETALLAQLGEGFDTSLTPEQAAAEEFRLQEIAGDFVDPNDPLTQALIESAQRPTLRAFEEARLEDLGAFTSAGQNIQSSSPFFRARGIAQEGLAGALGDIATNVTLGRIDPALARQSEAAAGAEGQAATRATAEGQEISNLVSRLEAEALPRLIEDLGIERGLEEFQRRIEVLLSTLGLATEVTQVVPGAFGKASSANVGI